MARIDASPVRTAVVRGYNKALSDRPLVDQVLAGVVDLLWGEGFRSIVWQPREVLGEAERSLQRPQLSGEGFNP
jgi:hypothetical protein